MNTVRLCRVYDTDASGYRVLVDRLWPRGIKKEQAGLDEWLNDVAPSTELRRWYGHRPERFEEFARRYRDELGSQPAADALEHLADVADAQPVALLTATRDVEHSAAQVLLDVLTARRSTG